MAGRLQVTGEQFALGLDHAWACTHAGRDDWQQWLADERPETAKACGAIT